MEQICNEPELSLRFSEISRPDEFVSPFEGEEYVLLLVINRTDILYREQKDLSERIIASRCRYAVCFGFECSSWDGSIDYAFIFSDPNLSPPDERFVMTTWHEDESIEDVVEYLRFNTVFDEFVPKRFLVLFVGDDSELRRRVFETSSRFFGERPIVSSIEPNQ